MSDADEDRMEEAMRTFYAAFAAIAEQMNADLEAIGYWK